MSMSLRVISFCCFVSGLGMAGASAQETGYPDFAVNTKAIATALPANVPGDMPHGGSAFLSGSTVAIIRSSDAHMGAGVQIRKGLILTAAHVVRDDRTVMIKDDRGGVRVGTVRLAEHRLDLAFVDIPDSGDIGISPLSCVKPTIGLTVTLTGHPMGKEFQSFTGRVITGERAISDWPNLMIVDRFAFPGMSGGPVRNRDGAVVGVVVAAMSGNGSAAGPAGIVPDSAICGIVPDIQTAQAGPL